jgi:hypothetical protein
MSLRVLCLLCAVFAAKQQSSLRTIRTTVGVRQPSLSHRRRVAGSPEAPPHWLERGQPSRQSSLIVDPRGQVASDDARWRPLVRVDEEHIHAVQGNGNILLLSAAAVLTERFTRVALDTIQYGENYAMTDILSPSRADERAKKK